MSRVLTSALAVLSLAACSPRDEFEPWGARGVVAPSDSLTVSRVTGGPLTAAPLRSEPGNVWPVEEAPRATLMNPEHPERLAQQPIGSSSPPPPLPESRPTAPISPAAAPIPNSPPAPRSDGRVLPTGEVITEGPPGAQTFVTPGGGSGVAVPQGPTTILLGPDGRVRTVPTPR